MADSIPGPGPLEEEEGDEGTGYEDEGTDYDYEEEQQDEEIQYGDEEIDYDDEEEQQDEEDEETEYEDEETDYDDEEEEQEANDDETDDGAMEQQNVSFDSVHQPLSSAGVSLRDNNVGLIGSSSVLIVTPEEDKISNRGRRDREASLSSGTFVEWNRSEIDGLFCPICMEAWTNEGDHQICCLPCGHIYGMSCIKRWLEQRKNFAKCPQCNQRCTLKGVRKLFTSRIATVDEETQKRIQYLEAKCAALEKQQTSSDDSIRQKIDKLSQQVDELRGMVSQCIMSSYPWPLYLAPTTSSSSANQTQHQPPVGAHPLASYPWLPSVSSLGGQAQQQSPPGSYMRPPLSSSTASQDGQSQWQLYPVLYPWASFVPSIASPVGQLSQQPQPYYYYPPSGSYYYNQPMNSNAISMQHSHNADQGGDTGPSG